MATNRRFTPLPDTSDAAAQYMLLYEMSGGGQMDKLVGYDYDIARLTVKMPTMGTEEVTRFIQEVTEVAEPLFEGLAAVEITGAMALAKALNDRMAKGVKSSFLAVLVAVTLLMIVFFKVPQAGPDQHGPQCLPRACHPGAHGVLRYSYDHAADVLQLHYRGGGRGRYHPFFQALSQGVQSLRHLCGRPGVHPGHGWASDYFYYADPDSGLCGDDPFGHEGMESFRFSGGLCLFLGPFGGFLFCPCADAAAQNPLALKG